MQGRILETEKTEVGKASTLVINALKSGELTPNDFLGAVYRANVMPKVFSDFREVGSWLENYHRIEM